MGALSFRRTLGGWSTPTRRVSVGLARALAAALLVLAGSVAISHAFSAQSSGAAAPAQARAAVLHALAHSGGRLRSRFSTAGAEVAIGSTPVVRLRMLAIGRGADLSAIGAVAPSIRRGTVSYERGGVVESYASSGRGLEQTFVIGRRLAGRGSLTLAVGALAHGIGARELAGGLRLSVGNQPIAEYGRLRVTDATGLLVPARIVLRDGRILLVIDDRDARYPLRVDPWVRTASLNAPGGVGAYSVAASASGQAVVVGSGDSKAYVFTEPKGGWKNVSHATATIRASGQFAPVVDFGVSVAISANGDEISVGATGSGQNSPDGLTYIYKKPSNGWQHTSGKPIALLSASDPTQYDFGFGSSVAMNAAGDRIVVGDPAWNGQGALYLFNEPSNGWHNMIEGQSASVGESGWCPPSPAGCLDGGFGANLSMSAGGDTVVAGASEQDQAEGGLYVFYGVSKYSIGPYVQLTDPYSGSGSASCVEGLGPYNPELGQSVALSGDGRTLVASLPCEKNGGAVAVYDDPPGGWSQAPGYFSGTQHGPFTAALGPAPPYRADNQEFGGSLALSGDGSTIVADDPDYPSSGGFLTAISRFPHGWGSNAEPKDFDSFFAPTPLQNLYGETSPLALSSDGSTLFVAGTGGHVNSHGLGPGVLYVFDLRHTPTSLKCASPVQAGAHSKCTVTVQDSNGGKRTPTGTVTFSSNAGSSGKFNHKSCRLGAEHGHAGTAQCSVDFDPQKAGGFLITAKYGGDSYHDSNTATATVTTSKAVTVTSLTCVSPVHVAVEALCTARVKHVASGAPAVDFPSIAGVTLSGRSCKTTGTTETCTIDFLAAMAKTYDLVARFPGDGSGTQSHYTYPVVVSLAPTSTSLICAPTSVPTDQSVACTATTKQITGPQAPPDIEFSVTIAGSTQTLPGACETTVGGASVTCTVATSFTTTGPATIVADFPGDADAGASTKDATISVKNPTTTSVLNCADDAGTRACDVAVEDNGADPTVPTGTVTLTASDPGTFGDGGTCTLAAYGPDGVCAITFTPTNNRLPVTITASYPGDAGHTSSTGDATSEP
jgi:Bacterial Ig-like domain (group 3)